MAGVHAACCVLCFAGGAAPSLASLPREAQLLLAQIASTTVAAGASVFFASTSAQVALLKQLAKQIEVGTASASNRTLFTELAAKIVSSPSRLAEVVAADGCVGDWETGREWERCACRVVLCVLHFACRTALPPSRGMWRYPPNSLFPPFSWVWHCRALARGVVIVPHAFPTPPPPLHTPLHPNTCICPTVLWWWCRWATTIASSEGAGEEESKEGFSEPSAALTASLLFQLLDTHDVEAAALVAAAKYVLESPPCSQSTAHPPTPKPPPPHPTAPLPFLSQRFVRCAGCVGTQVKTCLLLPSALPCLLSRYPPPPLLNIS